MRYLPVDCDCSLMGNHLQVPVLHPRETPLHSLAIVPPTTTRSAYGPFTFSGFAAFFGALGGGAGMPRICPSATSRAASFV